MKRKRKLKKRFIIILLIISLIIVGIYISGDNNEIAKVIKIDYIEKLSTYEMEGVNQDFLAYIEENYPTKLQKLYEIVKNNNYNLDIWYDLTGNSYNVLLDKVNNINYLEASSNTITFVGDTSLADNYFVMEAYKERNIGLEGIMSKEIIDYLNNSGLAIANSEFAFGTSTTPMPGKSYTFISDPSNVSLYHEMGIDLVTLANNHVYDYESVAFNTTLETFDNANIPRIGAGKNIDEASQAAYFIVNGYKVAFVNANRSEKYILTPEATETSEGVVRCYDPTYFISMIEKEKLTSDIVIAIIHWGAEYSHEIEPVLLETGKMYIDAGADAIVGHHAHVLQGIEMYNDKPIVYNLGNFIFNNKNLETAILTLEVNDDMSFTNQIIPALQSNTYTKFLSSTDKQIVIDKLNSWSINTIIDENGYFN